MRISLLLCSCVAFLTVSCGPSSKVISSTGHPPLPEDTPVKVLTAIQKASPEWTPVGQLKIGDSGLSLDCSYTIVVARAEVKAREMGGNVVKITRHKKPDLASSCHRIWADVYLAPADDPAFAEQEDKIDEALLDEGCAILYFYRSRNFAGSAIGYNVRIGDEVVWRASNNSKEWIKIQAVGQTRISAKTEAERNLVIDILPGRSYYIRCGIDMGFMVGRPSLELVDETTGKIEFDNIVEKK